MLCASALTVRSDGHERGLKKSKGVPMSRALPVARLAKVRSTVEPREWPNSGMGCTDVNLNVLPVITNGYEVILRAGSVEAMYHTDDGWFGGSIGFVRCR